SARSRHRASPASRRPYPSSYAPPQRCAGTSTTATPSFVSTRPVARHRGRVTGGCIASRRRRPGGRVAPRLAASATRSSGVILDPDGAVVRELLLPDRDDGLQLVDAVAGGGERGVSMRRARGDDHGDVAERESADAVMHHDARG